MSKLATLQKKAKGIANNIIDEMDENQLNKFIPFFECINFTDEATTSDEDEDEEEDEKPTKGKGKKSSKKDDDDEEEDGEEEADEEDDEEDEKPAKGKGKKSSKKKDDDDEEEDDEEEADDEEEDEKPAKGKGKKSSKKDDDDEEEDADDGDEDGEDDEVDYSSMKLPALKKLADERGLPTKTLAKNAKPEKAFIKALENYDETKASFMKQKLEKLIKLAEKNEVEYSKPRGRAGDDKKKEAVVAALLKAGVEA